MNANRRDRILAAVAEGEGPTTTRLCEVAAEMLDLSGAGVMLMSGDFPRGTVCSTDPVSTQIEDLQFNLGEGPGVDAYHGGVPVLVPNMETASKRWPAFGPQAVAAGVHAIFGFPVKVGAVRLGTLNLYRDAAGDLDDDQHANGLLMADVVARVLLALQAGAGGGTLVEELSRSGDMHFVVHQAAGMVSERLGVPVGTALVRLRAWAFAHERDVTEIAQAVVSRKLVFDPKDGEGWWQE